MADEDFAKPIDVQLSLQLRNRHQLDDLIRRVSTPGSREYGHYLTPAEFDAQFGPTAAQVSTATSFLRASGFQVTAAAPGSTLIDARGTVQVVQTALHTTIGHYREANGHEFFANDAAPAIPAELASLVVGIVGLDNRFQRHHSAVQPRVCPPTCASTPYTPAQIQAAYRLNVAPLASFTGAGQVLGLFELDDFRQPNVDAYNSTYSLPPLSPQRLSVDGGAPITNGGELEVELDIELMHAIAPGASIMVFEGPNTDPGANDTYSCIVNPNAAIAIGSCPNLGSGVTLANSTSWGTCEAKQTQIETQTLDGIFARAASQGQSFFAASGDNGAHDCTPPNGPVDPALAVDSPASDPYITAAGGTNLRLNTDNSINSEVGWSTRPNSWNGSGGGMSSVFSRAPWEVGPGVDTTSGAMRQVPDISLDADPNTGYSIYSCLSSAPSPPGPACTGTGAGLESLGGTSAGAPAWAAFAAVYNQYAATQSKPALGFANPTLYTLGACPPAVQPYNDVISGDNKVGTGSGYSAGPAYDMVTGWGSMRAAELAQALLAVGPAGVKVTSVSPAQGSTSDGVQVNGCGFETFGGQVPTVTFGTGNQSPSVVVNSSTSLNVVVPAHAPGVVDVTVTNPTGSGGAPFTLTGGFTYTQPPPPPPHPPAPPPPPSGGTSLYSVLRNFSGSGQIEVHGLSQASNYTQFNIHAASVFGLDSAADWQFFVGSFHGDGQPDLFGVKQRNTGSNRVEVHVLSAASGYQTFLLHAATALGVVPADGSFQFTLGSFAGDHNSNLYAILTQNTGSHRVEVHVLSEASNYTSWALHSASAFAASSATATGWQFRIGDRFGSGDLVGISHQSTGSGRTEVHVLSRSSGYQSFTLHVAAPLGYTNDNQFAYTLGNHDNDGSPDIYAVLMNSSSSGYTEVHILSGASNYTAWIEHVASALGPTNTYSWQFSAR